MDVLLEANQSPGNYFIAARAYVGAEGARFDKMIETAFLQYQGSYHTRDGASCPNEGAVAPKKFKIPLIPSKKLDLTPLKT